MAEINQNLQAIEEREGRGQGSKERRQRDLKREGLELGFKHEKVMF